MMRTFLKDNNLLEDPPRRERKSKTQLQQLWNNHPKTAKWTSTLAFWQEVPSLLEQLASSTSNG